MIGLSVTTELAWLRHENKQLKKRIKRLEAAGDAMFWVFMHPFDTVNECIPDAWRKAKEAKP